MRSITMPTTPRHLTVETGGDEFLVAPRFPELSWTLPAGLEAQESYELEALIDEQLHTHQGRTPEHRYVPWPWGPLRSGANVQWRVRTVSGGEASDWSSWSQFEAGLFESDWASTWVSSPVGDDLEVGQRPAYAFVSEFEVHTTPTDARVYAAALGVYEVFINGHRVGRSELAPGSESYDKTLYAQAYNAGDALIIGTNKIEIVLSDGWYRGRAGAFRKQAAWGTTTAVRAEVRAGRGEEAAVLSATNTSWKVHQTEILTADLMDGQISDFSRGTAAIGDAIPTPGPTPEVSWSPAPPVRVMQELRPVEMNRIASDTYVVDFGQNASGRIRLSSLGPAGARTRLDFGEHVDVQGDVTLSHLDTPNMDGSIVPFVQHDEVVSNGDPQVAFEPRHTLHGFRYVRVQREGLTLHPDDIVMQVMHSDLRPVGSFNCSDRDLVKLYEVADWSFRGNAVDVPTDCPTRERAGWTGDWQIFLPTAVRLYDVNGFSRKWLQSVRDDQLDDGRIVNVSPDHGRLRVVPDPMTDMATGSAGWGDAVVLVPWELYRTYGDRRVLEENWEAMSRWADFGLRSAEEHRHSSRVERSIVPLPHEKYIWDGTFHFGEWLEPAPIADDGTAMPVMADPAAWFASDKGEVGTAYLYRTTSTLARIAAVLGRHEDASRLTAAAARVREAWQIEFLDDEAHTAAGTQASYVRALAFGLVPEDLRDRAAGHLVALVQRAGNHLGTGFLSTADLLPVLADNGHPELAHSLLLQRSTPSWLGMIDRGATTIWEEWEGVDRNGVASASLNHYSKGAVIRYLQTHTLGLAQRDDSIAWESFVVAPVVPEHVSWAHGHFDCPQGRIEVAWNIDGDTAHLKVAVPPGSKALVRWGEVNSEFGAGDHNFKAQPAAVAVHGRNQLATIRPV